MPTYDYECRNCSYKFEAFQSIRDEPLKRCPRCGKGVRRLFGGGMGIIFKGSGFYVTDHKASTANLMPKSEHGASKAPEEKHSSESQGSKESEK